MISQSCSIYISRIFRENLQKKKTSHTKVNQLSRALLCLHAPSVYNLSLFTQQRLNLHLRQKHTIKSLHTRQSQKKKKRTSSPMATNYTCMRVVCTDKPIRSVLTRRRVCTNNISIRGNRRARNPRVHESFIGDFSSATFK